MVTKLARAGIPVTTSRRVLRVSTSGYYEWRGRGPSARALDDAELTAVITEIHRNSRGTYGSPRVHAELRLGHRNPVGRGRVERLMRCAGLQGAYRRRRRRGSADPAVSPHPDLVNRRFTADAPDRLWCMDITQHRTDQGWIYRAVVLDAFSRRIVGWPIADHGTQYTSGVFSQQLRSAGLLGSMDYERAHTTAQSAA